MSGCSFGWKFWWFEGSVVLEFNFFQVFKGDDKGDTKRWYSGSVVIGRVFFPIIQRWWEHLETSAEIRGSLFGWMQSRGQKLGTNIKVSRGVLAHILIFSASKRIADWRSGSLMRELYYEKPLRLCIKIKNSHVLGRSRSLVLPQHLILFPPLFLDAFCR